MKRFTRMFAIILLASIVGLVPAVLSQAASLTVKYNGKKQTYKGAQFTVSVDSDLKSMKTPGIQISGTNMVPANEVFHTILGGTYRYTKSTGKIVITYGDNTVTMKLGSTTAYINDVKTTISVAPLKIYFYQAKTTRIYVPVRFVAEEGLALDYSYDKAGGVLALQTKGSANPGSSDNNTGDNTDDTEPVYTGLKLYYDGAWQDYTGTQAKVSVLGNTLSTSSLPGIILNSTTLVRAKQAFASSAIGASYSYSSSSKTCTITKGSNTVVFKIDSSQAVVNGVTRTMGTKARIIKNAAGTSFVCVPAGFTAEALGYVYQWKSASQTGYITEKTDGSGTGTSTGDNTGSGTSSGGTTVKTSEEMRAIWISFLDFDAGSYTESSFTSYVNTMFDRAVDLKMNAVVVQVRPFGDALYASSYFPWSSVLTGTQGQNPGYDPLAIMVKLAHAKGLEIHAWVNPYRITLSNYQSYSSLSADNPAKIWLSNDSSSRNVLKFSNQYYYNPASTEVQDLIVNGIREIVQKYNVDGIHFDDYFYPSLGSSYASTFDADEYDTYAAVAGSSAMDIVSWRRNNVDTLLQKVYSAIKAVRPSCVFGISPAGNMDNLYLKTSYYCDVKKWCSESGYIDYICPQIYWGFTHSTCPFKTTTMRWASIVTNPNVKLYLGLAMYKAGENLGSGYSDADEWLNSGSVIRDQVIYGRSVSDVDGFFFFRYDSFNGKSQQTEVTNLESVLN